MLSERLKARLVLENFEENMLLAKFYEDPDHYAFQTQIFFLLSKFNQQQALCQAVLFHEYDITGCIFDKDKISPYLTLQDDELKLYEAVLGAIEKNIPVPDLVVYLQSSVDRLMKNIRSRGRAYEENMSEEYIHALNEAYNYFFFRYKTSPLLIVKATDIDFVNNEKDFQDLLEQILRPNRAPIEYYNPMSKGA